MLHALCFVLLLFNSCMYKLKFWQIDEMLWIREVDIDEIHLFFSHRIIFSWNWLCCFTVDYISITEIHFSAFAGINSNAFCIDLACASNPHVTQANWREASFILDVLKRSYTNKLTHSTNDTMESIILKNTDGEDLAVLFVEDQEWTLT